ncbi:MAG: hypothetical protein ABWY10_14660 [Tardiphaga sp.]
MSDNVENAVFDILKKIQGDLSLVRSDVGQFKRESETRFERLETILLKHRRDSAGMLVMMRSVASDFDERVTEVERKIQAMEARDS